MAVRHESDRIAGGNAPARPSFALLMRAWPGVTLLIFLASVLLAGQLAQGSVSLPPSKAAGKQQQVSAAAGASGASQRPLEAAAFEQQQQQQQQVISPTSYKIIASGWPSTSPMWPSMDTLGLQADETNKQVVEPFIYADEPRKIDYSLLLSLNATLIELIKSQAAQKDKRIGVNLSFEYYFNHDQQVETTPPAIKIELDRSEFRFLKPGQAQASGEPIRTRIWTKFNEQIRLTDFSGLDNADWLKFSLVNRKASSLVAIRRLKVKFIAASDATAPAPAPSPAPAGPPSSAEPGAVSPAAGAQPQSPPLDSATGGRAPASNDLDAGSQVAAAPGAAPPVAGVPEGAPDDQVAGPASAPGPAPQPGEQADQANLAPAPPVSDLDQVPQASNILTSTIKPVPPRRSWSSWVGRRRRKRQVAGGSELAVTIVELDCVSSDSCGHWRTTEQSDRLQWSLARMPPTIESITRGYHYASNAPAAATSSGSPPVGGSNTNESNGGLLKLELNETEQATNADRASDHCIELALYVTEGARLRLYRLDRRSHEQRQLEQQLTGDSSEWSRGALLFTWAPSVQAHRQALPGSQLEASKQAGWTSETLCFATFFTSLHDCGTGQCALGFEMSTPTSATATGSSSDSASSGAASEQPPGGKQVVEAEPGEQVVGVALLREFASTAPRRAARRWLQTWRRELVAPGQDWRFFPGQDFRLASDNVSLANMLDQAHYSMQSEWLHADEVLDFEAIFSLEISVNNSSSGSSAEQVQQQAARSEAQLQQQQAQLVPVALVAPAVWPAGNQASANEQLLELKITRKLVNSNFEPFHELVSPISWFSADINEQQVSAGTQLVQFNLSLASLAEQIRQARQTGKLGELAQLDEPASQPAELGQSVPQQQQQQQQQQQPSDLFKLIVELELDVHWPAVGQLASRQPTRHFRLSVSNVSLADRCFPSPCEFGDCQQTGTKFDDWRCACTGHHRGRRCEFGKWCEHPHVLAPAGSALVPVGAQQASQVAAQQLGARKQPQFYSNQIPVVQLGQASHQQQQQQPSQQQQQQTLLYSSGPALTGEQFCARKLGPGAMCSELDVPLTNSSYQDEGATFACSCRGDYYLGDEGKCRRAHACNSIVCPEIGQICDESRPFNASQPCACNERQDYYLDPTSNRCQRRQCHDKLRDCGFEAHVCLPTLPGERPVCKCGPKFALRTTGPSSAGDKAKRECQSTACVLPTLNDCEQICVPNSANLTQPWHCDCHPGFALDKDGRSCRPSALAAPHCKPACEPRTQVCTELGCRCKQGFVAEGAQVVQVAQRAAAHSSRPANSSALLEYTRSVHCLNVCSLSYAENKAQFERIESVCPLGLCEPRTFECRCQDPAGSSLKQTKYEPIWAPDSESSGQDGQQPASSGEAQQHQQLANHYYNLSERHQDEHEQADADGARRRRASPLCHLRRVCQPDSAGFQVCRARGAICVPDYEQAQMFDCVCPPWSEKRITGQTGEFVCEPRCSAIRQECLKKQAVCRPTDRDQVRCDCTAGMILDKQEHKCYLARYSYSLQLLLVNKYYEPEWKFHRLLSSPTSNSSSSSSFSSSAPEFVAPLQEFVAPHFVQRQLDEQLERQAAEPTAGTAARPRLRSMFIAEHNQCNISQVLPKQILEDPYEHDMHSYLGYIEQCNERVHDNSRTYHLNSRLAEDVRQSLRQHLVDFTVYTNQSLCKELIRPAPQVSHHRHQPQVLFAQESPLDTSHFQQQQQQQPPQQVGSPDTLSYLNCTIFLQSHVPINESLVGQVFSDCDKNGADQRFCWIKPRLLLARRAPWPGREQHVAAAPTSGGQQGAGEQPSPTGGAVDATNQTQQQQQYWAAVARDQLMFRQIVACEMDGFCTDDAYSVRHDESSSLCSCKCPADIEMIDLKELEPRRNLLSAQQQQQQQLLELNSLSNQHLPRHLGAIKEICAPRNRCSAQAGGNATLFCLHKPGSVCHYDIRTGSRCQCVYPSYENNDGHCVEVAFSSLDSTLIVIILLLGTGFLVSLAINLVALVKARRGKLFGQSAQYPLHEFSVASAATSNQQQQRAAANAAARPLNRSTGVPNLAFNSDDE